MDSAEDDEPSDMIPQQQRVVLAGRSQSVGSEQEVEEMSRSSAASRAWQRNARRRRRREEAAKRCATTLPNAPPLVLRDRASVEKVLKKVKKSLRSINEMPKDMTEEQKRKSERRDDFEALEAALSARLAEINAERKKHDAVVSALSSVKFDQLFECGVCFEVIETPTVIKVCGHEFCRACIESLIFRATRGRDVACPLCRANFYDGTSKTAKLAAATQTKMKLKKAQGNCHCGLALPLSALRDHLRICGDAANCYEPRTKFGHDFLKPDFPRAIKQREISLDAAQTNEPLAAAMIRRFEKDKVLPRPSSLHDASSSSRDATENEPFMTRDDKKTTEEEEEKEEAPLPTQETTEPTTEASSSEEIKVPKMSLRDIMLQEEKQRDRQPPKRSQTENNKAPWSGEEKKSPWAARASWGTKPESKEDNLEEPTPRRPVPLSAFLTPKKASSSTPETKKHTTWEERTTTKALLTPKPPSVQTILAEEDRKRKDHAERLSSPWAGAVARHLQSQTAATPPPPPPQRQRSNKVH